MPFDAAPPRGNDGDAPFDAAPMGYPPAPSPVSAGSVGTASSSSTLPPPPPPPDAWDSQECLKDLDEQAASLMAASTTKPYDPIESAKMFEKEKMAASTKPASSNLLSKVAAVASKAKTGRPPVTSANNSGGAYAFKRSESYDTAELIRKYGKYSQAAQAQAAKDGTAGGASSSVPFKRSNSTNGAASPTAEGANIRSQALKVLDLVDDRLQKPVEVRRTESGGFRASASPYAVQRTLSNASSSSARHVPSALAGLGMAAGEASLSLSSPHDYNGGERVGNVRSSPHVTFGGVDYHGDDDEVEDEILIDDDAPLVDVVQMQNRAAGRFSNSRHNKMEAQLIEEDLSDHDGSSEHSRSSGAPSPDRTSAWSSRYAHMPKSSDPRVSQMLDNMDREHSRGLSRISARNMFAATAYDNNGQVHSPVKGNGRVFGAGFSFRNQGLRAYRDMDDQDIVDDQRNLNVSVYHDEENDGGFEDQSPPVHKTWQAAQQKRRRRRNILVLLLCLMCLAVVIGTLASLLTGNDQSTSAAASSGAPDNQVVDNKPKEGSDPDETPDDITNGENIIENNDEDKDKEKEEDPEVVVDVVTDAGTRFFVTSDVPYDIDAKVKLASDLVALKKRDGNFLMHLGNVQDNSYICPAEKYQEVADLFVADSPVPVLITPGSHDWSKCPLPQASFEHWIEAFGEGFDSNFDFNSTVYRQRDIRENFAWLHDGVLFLGMHLVYDDPVATRQEGLVKFYFGMLNMFKGDYRALVIFGNAKATSEFQGFFGGVATTLKSIGVPVAYVHANHDGHHDVLKYRPFDDMPTMLAIEVAKGSHVAPLRITVARDILEADEVFSISAE